MMYADNLDRHEEEAEREEVARKINLLRGNLVTAKEGYEVITMPTADDIASKVVEQMTPLVCRLIEEREREKIINQQAAEIATLKEHLRTVLEAGRRAFHDEPYSKETSQYLELYANKSVWLERQK